MLKNNLLKLVLIGSLSLSFASQAAVNEQETFAHYLKKSAYKGLQDVVSVPLGWAGNAGLAYYAYAHRADLSGMIAAGSLVAYHGTLIRNWWTLRCDFNEMSIENTGNDISKRTLWAGHSNGHALWTAYQNASQGQKNQIRANILSILGNQKLHEQIQAELAHAIEVLDTKLAHYASYTNILDHVAYGVTGTHNHDQLLKGNALINNDHSQTIASVLAICTKNSWIGNSLNIGLYWKNRIPVRLPWFYTSTYNEASKCVVKVLEHYTRIKAVKAIIDSPHAV